MKRIRLNQHQFTLLRSILALVAIIGLIAVEGRISPITDSQSVVCEVGQQFEAVLPEIGDHETEPFVAGSSPRSSHWHTVRDKFLKSHPCCEACGCTTDLEAHHIKPFSSFPADHHQWAIDPELDPDNLITLCRKPANHHLFVGHGGWFSKANLNVRADAARMMRLIKAGDQNGQRALTDEIRDRSIFSHDIKWSQNQKVMAL